MRTDSSALVVGESMQLARDVATQEEVTLEKVLYCHCRRVVSVSRALHSLHVLVHRVVIFFFRC